MGRMTRRGMLKATAGVGVAAAAPAGVIAAGAPPALAEPGFELPAATDAVTPFRLRVPESALADLRRRLAATRFPDREVVNDATEGPQLQRMRRLVGHWQHRYDWRRVETRLNGFGQYRTRLDGLGIHFLHVRSRHRNALPMVMTHGWPGSVVEFLDVIGPLTDPTAFGGSAADAFHLVLPSLPGFAFSDKPTAPGWDLQRIARAWAQLMTRLGYDRYVAQGGDWGSGVVHHLGIQRPPQLAGVHATLGWFNPPVVGEPTPEEKEALDKAEKFQTDGSGYFTEMATRPQQMGYSLSDSPAGQAAWIYEKFSEWTDSNGDPESVLGFDRMLDDIMLYWLPATAASSARIYREAGNGFIQPGDVQIPVGYTTFPFEIVPLPRVWAERAYPNLVYFNRAPRGGHFAAFEQPRIFTDEMRKFGRHFR